MVPFGLSFIIVTEKYQSFRTYARTNAKIKNRMKITSGEFKELSNDVSVDFSSHQVAEKIVYKKTGKKKKEEKKHNFIRIFI